jgi:hypothetical protein
VWLAFSHKHQRAQRRDKTLNSLPSSRHYLDIAHNDDPFPSPYSSPFLTPNRRFHASRQSFVLTKPSFITPAPRPQLRPAAGNHHNVRFNSTDAATSTAWRLHQHTCAQFAPSVLIHKSSTAHLQITFTTSTIATARCTTPVAVSPTTATTSTATTTTAKWNGRPTTTCA